jgi:fructoselysine-6-P-deglycase FrlB-like protein
MTDNTADVSENKRQKDTATTVPDEAIKTVTLTDEERAQLADAEKMTDLYDWRPNARIAAVESIIAARLAGAAEREDQ